MRLHQKEPFTAGYQSITELGGKHSEMLMDFGILKLTAGMEFTDEKPLERVFVLLYGEIEVEFGGKRSRESARPTQTIRFGASICRRTYRSSCAAWRKTARLQSSAQKTSGILPL